MFAWPDLVLGAVVIIALLLLGRWLGAVEADVCDKEQRWLEKKLTPGGWQVDGESRRLDTLKLPQGCLREYPRWAHAYLVSTHSKPWETTWLFRVRTQESLFAVRALSNLDHSAVIVVQASHGHFPHVTLISKHFREHLWIRRGRVRPQTHAPRLCQHWRVYIDDSEKETLELLSTLEDTLDAGSQIRTIEFSSGYVAFVGERVEGRTGLWQFINDVRYILTSLAESDPFSDTLLGRVKGDE